MKQATKDALRDLANRIAAFDRLCEEEQETDTGEAWEILNEAKRLLRKAAREG